MIYKYRDFEPVIHPTCYLAPNCSVIGNVNLGNNVSIWHNAVLRGDVAKISIGDDTNIQDGCVLHCKHDVELIIGKSVTVGHGAILHSCSIGDFSLVGMGAIVLDGATIGQNCLIGAGALVVPNMKIPDGSLVLGSPAAIKRQLTDDELEQIRVNAKEYIWLAEDYKNS